MISIKNLSFSYNDDTSVLEDISFDIKKGEIVALIGPNGSGKTTLVKNILGLLEPSKGSVTIDKKSPKEVRSKFAYVPQRFDFDRTTPLTVKEFLELDKCKHHSFEKIDDFLESVDLLDFKKKRLGSLSGGQFQKVMIARALLHEKEFLVFDEPSTGIDITGEQTVYELIEKINKEQGITVIIVSHELNIVSRYASNVICLNKCLVCSGAPEKILKPKNLEKLFGGDIALYHGH